MPNLFGSIILRMSDLMLRGYNAHKQAMKNVAVKMMDVAETAIANKNIEYKYKKPPKQKLRGFLKFYIWRIAALILLFLIQRSSTTFHSGTQYRLALHPNI